MKNRSVISGIIVGIVALSVLGVALSSYNNGDIVHENTLRIAYFPNIGACSTDSWNRTWIL